MFTFSRMSEHNAWRQASRSEGCGGGGRDGPQRCHSTLAPAATILPACRRICPRAASTLRSCCRSRTWRQPPLAAPPRLCPRTHSWNPAARQCPMRPAWRRQEHWRRRSSPPQLPHQPQQTLRRGSTLAAHSPSVALASTTSILMGIHTGGARSSSDCRRTGRIRDSVPVTCSLWLCPACSLPCPPTRQLSCRTRSPSSLSFSRTHALAHR